MKRWTEAALALARKSEELAREQAAIQAQMAAMQAWKDSLVPDEAKASPGFTAQALRSLAGGSRDAARSTVHDWVH
jgi:hypothetical protein